MGKRNATPWVVGAFVLALLMGAGAWFFGISPQLERASTMNQQAQVEATRADQLRIQLAGLKKAHENLDTYKADLAGLQAQLPASVKQADLQRQLDDMATGAGVFVDSVTFGVPVEVTPPVQAAPAAPATDGTSGDTATGDTATGDTAAGDTVTGTGADQAAAAAPTLTGFYAQPVEITTTGSFAATVELFNRLQTQAPRLIVVNNFNATALKQAGGQSGRPATADGDLETVIHAWVYVLLDDAAPASDPAAPAESDGTAPALPTPGTGAANPFAPAT